MYTLMINNGSGAGWTQQIFDDIINALEYVRVHHHTRLVYPCGSIAEYIQGSLIDLR